MAITKKNKRNRGKRVLPRNANLIRIPKDNTISLVVWDDKEGRATRTPLTTEEAGNVAMYLAKQKKIVGPGASEMVSKATEDAKQIKYLEDALSHNNKFIREQEDARRKLANEKRDMSQAITAMCNAHRHLIDIIQNTMGRTWIPEPDIVGSNEKKSVGLVSEPLPSSVNELTRKIFDADLKTGR